MNDDIMAYQPQGYLLAPAAALNAVLAVYQAKKDFIEKVLREGVDFGKIPGATKPALLKPGAEKLSSFFALTPTFHDVAVVEDWTGVDHGGEPFFYYRQRCSLSHGDRLVASADGSCNSWEKKYRYRQAERVCPDCKKATIIKGKTEYGGGWVCFTKKGGCGAKFTDGDQVIEGQQTGQTLNPDVAEQVNTILKMAQKRALIAATLIATGASDYFTQDMEDFIQGEFTEVRQPAPAATVAPVPPTGNAVPPPPPAPAVYPLRQFVQGGDTTEANIETTPPQSPQPKAKTASEQKRDVVTEFWKKAGELGIPHDEALAHLKEHNGGFEAALKALL